MDNNFIDISIPQNIIDKFKVDSPTYKERFMTENRWMGKIGEEAFRIVFHANNTPFIDLTKSGPSWVDFKVGDHKIDVKTIITSYYPIRDYGCNVEIGQHEQNNEATDYLFVRFIKNRNLAVIVGYCSKYFFSKNAVLRMAENKVADAFTPTKDFYEVLIGQLNPIHLLFTP